MIRVQPQLAVEPVNALMIIPPALPPEHDVNSAVILVDPGFGDFPDSQAQGAFICRNGAVLVLIKYGCKKNTCYFSVSGGLLNFLFFIGSQTYVDIYKLNIGARTRN